MNRREVLPLLPVVSMAAASRVDAATGKNVDQGLVLEAPEDVFVVRLPKLQGKVQKRRNCSESHVTEGQLASEPT